MKEKYSINFKAIQRSSKPSQYREGIRTVSVISQRAYVWRKQQKTKLHSLKVFEVLAFFFPIVNWNKNKIFQTHEQKQNCLTSENTKLILQQFSKQ